jgi:TPR repeat protein
MRRSRGAARWLRRAAEQNFPAAQHNLGLLYLYGQGVRQDYIQAHMWLNLAATRFTPGADRDAAVRNRDGVAARMTPAQVAEAQRLAREWDAAHPAAR